MNKIVWISLTFLAGALLPLQAGLNAKLGKAGGSPIHASMISFIVGALSLVAYVLVTKQQISWTGMRTAPAYSWIGGAMGAFYVTMIVLAFPRLGPGLTFGMVVAGQMVFSVLLEHFDILVAEKHPVNLFRIMGVLLIVIGVIIIRKS